MGLVLMTVFEAFAGSRQSDSNALVLSAVAMGAVSLTGKVHLVPGTMRSAFVQNADEFTELVLSGYLN